MISLSILQTHEPKNLRKFISEANKRIRATISAEIKEERKKFSIKMMEKRKIEKEKRIIKIPLRAKKDDLIKVIMDNKKHFKEIEKNVTKQDKIKDLENEINEMKNKIKELNSKQLNELSKKYMDFKKLAGLENKKFKGIVKEIYKREQELKKPKIPTIKIIEEEYKTDGGGAADPKAKEFKIPKPTSKLRIVPKKPKAQLGQSGLGQKRKRVEGKPKKKKIIDVEVKENTPKQPPKPKPPTIIITEEPKSKRKVLKVGGRFITPKPKAEVKSSLPPIPKTKNKIRLPKKQSLEKKLKELKVKPEPESDEDEPDEIPYKDFKLIEGVPKNIKKIWYDYVDDRSGYANKANQDNEIEELQRIEKNYIEAEATRKNKSVSAKKQLKAVRTIGSILIEIRNDINGNPDLKKIYKLFIPTILKKVLGEIEKDKQDLIKEQKAILKQEKEDEKAYKKLLKEEEKENKSK